MSDRPPITQAELARLIERQRVLVGQLVAIRDAIVRPQQHSRPGRGFEKTHYREADREAYAGTLAEFSQWCQQRDVSFPLTLKRMAELVMGRIDVEPEGELTDRINGVAGAMRQRMEAAGRDVA